MTDVIYVNAFAFTYKCSLLSWTCSTVRNEIIIIGTRNGVAYVGQERTRRWPALTEMDRNLDLMSDSSDCRFIELNDLHPVFRSITSTTWPRLHTHHHRSNSHSRSHRPLELKELDKNNQPVALLCANLVLPSGDSERSHPLSSFKPSRYVKSWFASEGIICFRSVLRPRSFVRTDLVTTISHEWLEQSRWNLQGIFNSPYWLTG